MTRGARWAGWAAIIALFLWSAWATEVSLARTVEGIPFVLDFLRRMVPPDFSVVGHALRGATQTLQIAIVGTAIAAVLALPVGFAAARNMSPPWLFYGARSILNLFRAIDTLVYALIFVAAVGLGPFPGVLAVVAYTATVLAKLYSEAIEAIDPGPVEAVAATGAKPSPGAPLGGAAPARPAVLVLHPVPVRDQYPGGNHPGLRRGRGDRVLHPDVSPHARTTRPRPRCCSC